MKIWCVCSKYFDDFHAEVNMYEEELNNIPANSYESRTEYDIYCDYFDNEKEAKDFYEEAKKAQ